MGHSTRWDANNHLFTKASTSFDADRESDGTNRVLSYLLHYWFGSPNTYRDSHWWLAAAIRSAQCMGYHRSTKNSKIPAKVKSRWKRIWWCLYVSSQSPLIQGISSLPRCGIVKPPFCWRSHDDKWSRPRCRRTSHGRLSIWYSRNCSIYHFPNGTQQSW